MWVRAWSTPKYELDLGTSFCKHYKMWGLILTIPFKFYTTTFKTVTLLVFFFQLLHPPFVFVFLATSIYVDNRVVDYEICDSSWGSCEFKESIHLHPFDFVEMRVGDVTPRGILKESFRVALENLLQDGINPNLRLSLGHVYYVS